MKLDIRVFFEKSVEEIQVSLKSDKKHGCKTHAHVWQYPAEFYLK